MTSQLLHFVVRNITYTPTLTGYLVTCYTNYPCHLWLRWTSTRPEKHIHATITRGAQIGTYIDQCFVVYTDLEQNEAGDTYTHTFTAQPWPNCETRWFYFWGTVGRQLSPSASAIFSYHSTALTIYCQNSPNNTPARTRLRCNCVSFPLRPCASFTLTHWKTHLCRYLTYNPQDTFELWIFTADVNCVPVTQLAYATITGIYLPPLPNWLDIDFAIPPTPLQQGNNYAVVWRVSDGYKDDDGFYICQDGGYNNTCAWTPLPPIAHYYTACGFGPDNYCNSPPGPAGWKEHAGGGVQYYVALGTQP